MALRYDSSVGRAKTLTVPTTIAPGESLLLLAFGGEVGKPCVSGRA